MFSANTTQVSGGYQISRSLRFNSPDTAYLNRTPASASNRTTWTWSGWVKRSALGAISALETVNGNNVIWFNASDVLQVALDSGGDIYTSQVFRDVSAWYHIVVATDTTQATASNRVKIYVNGNQITAFSSAAYPTQNSNTGFNTAAAHYLGSYVGSNYFFNGYMTEINFIDGQALTPSSFGQTDSQTGVWGPKAYSGSYGTNGFYVNFSDNSNTTAATLGKDYSGNGNNWTPNNFSVSAGAGNDSLVDVPTSYGTDTGAGGTVRGNYGTWNALDKSASITLTNGNLDCYVGSGSFFSIRSTIGMSSGKWYWESVPDSNAGTLVGINTSAANLNNYPGSDAYGWGYYQNGNKLTNGGTVAYGASFGAGDVLGVAFDADAGTLTFYKNGVSQGVAFSGLTSGPYFATIGMAGMLNIVTNFGQRPFAYTAPSGYKALCTQNLPAGTITTSGTFIGNGSADGPFVYLNGVPTAMTINGNAVTFATNADKLSNGFKVRTSSASYNNSGVSNTYSITTTGDKFKYALAQTNP